MYEVMVGTRSFIMWSRKDETHSVGPLQPLTIGLIPWGFLWSFLRSTYVVFSPCQSDAGRHGCMCLYSLLLSCCLLVLLCPLLSKLWGQNIVACR